MLVTAMLATVCCDVDSAIATIQSVQMHGQNQVAVREASEELQSASPDELVAIAEAMGTGDLADNWLRGAFETAAARAIAADAFPAESLREFFDDRSNNPRARRMVYEFLSREGAASGLTPSLDDPSAEMRRDAVAAALDQAKEASGEAALAIYRSALAGATLPSQVDAIAEKLEESGEPVDRLQHYGYLTEWRLVGPFDNKDEASFDVAFAPETTLDFASPVEATYEGETGAREWVDVRIDDESGTVDLHKLMENYKGSVVYAVAAFESDLEQPIELRLSTANAWKLWLNDELLFGRPEYHRGKRFDQYRLRTTAKAGKNVLLIKLLQNEQDQSWAQDFDVAVRVTNPAGLAADVTSVVP